MGAELFHVDGRTDMTKLIVAFRNFANAPNNNDRGTPWTTHPTRNDLVLNHSSHGEKVASVGGGVMAKYMVCFAAANVERYGQSVVRYHQITFPCNSLHTNGLWKFLIRRANFFRRVCKTCKSDYWLCQVCPSVHMGQLGSHWTDFNEIWYPSTSRKYVEKIQVLFKSDKNNATLRGGADKSLAIP